MTHLACADEDEDNFSDKQISLLENIVSDINIELSIFNSAGIIKYSKKFENSQHWIRPGLILYGINPLSSCDEINVKPVMNLLAPIISIKKCKKGDFVGYGQTYKIKNDTNVAAVGIGYGDGLPRRLSNIGKVFTKGNIFNIIGRVSMDIIMIDIHDKDIKIGSDVELWGENISIKDVSCSIDAIPYELMCSLGNRLSKEYI
jgi:alanine racemase